VAGFPECRVGVFQVVKSRVYVFFTGGYKSTQGVDLVGGFVRVEFYSSHGSLFDLDIEGQCSPFFYQ
jgi:hypothetical protein